MDGVVPITLEVWLTFLETPTCKKEYHSICMKLGKDGESSVQKLRREFTDCNGEEGMSWK